MNEQTTNHKNLTVTLTAHEDNARKLLLARLEVADLQPTKGREPARVALVLDRSGSMSGRKLEIAKRALATFIRSLSPDDRVAVVTYDDQVDVLTPLAAPSDRLAQRIESIDPGGSTALYEGWLMGAKLVGAGGRVVLLSDGLANVGRITDAAALSTHAGISYTQYGVTTTTIGVGQDYDEALMAGMANAGGGGHYYAHTAEAILEAFSQERFSMGSIVLERVSLRYGSQTFQLGHLWGGESKAVAMQIDHLNHPPATLRFTEVGASAHETIALLMPAAFGHSDRATLEWIFKEAADVEDSVLSVRHPAAAREAKLSVRSVILSLLQHPLADTPEAKVVISRLQARLESLERLERQYDESEATMVRKRAMQGSFNIRHRAKAYSSFEEDQPAMAVLSAAAMPPAPRVVKFDPSALLLAPMDRWMSWAALPVRVDDNQVRVVLENAKDGFKISEMEKALGRRVRTMHIRMSSAEILQALREAQ